MLKISITSKAHNADVSLHAQIKPFKSLLFCQPLKKDFTQESGSSATFWPPSGACPSSPSPPPSSPPGACPPSPSQLSSQLCSSIFPRRLISLLPWNVPPLPPFNPFHLSYRLHIILTAASSE